MKQYALYLKAHGRRLRSFITKIVSNLFRNGKLALKIALKIPFFISIEATLETDWREKQPR